jgi:hypothetical protein
MVDKAQKLSNPKSKLFLMKLIALICRIYNDKSEAIDHSIAGWIGKTIQEWSEEDAAKYGLAEEY